MYHPQRRKTSMARQLLPLVLIIFAANLFGIGHISSSGVAPDPILCVVLAATSLLCLAIAMVVAASALKKKEKHQASANRNVRQSVVIPVRNGKVCMVS